MISSTIEAALNTANKTDSLPLTSCFPALGKSVVQANGHSADRPVIITHNYTSAQALDAQGVALRPPHISPTPSLDFPVNYLAAAAVPKGEMALTLTLAPGVSDYLVERGLISSTDQLIQVDPSPLANANKLGLGFTDPVAAALRDGIDLSGNYFVASFPTPAVREMVSRLGATTVQRFDPEACNNKARLHEDRHIHRLNISHGVLVNSELDVARCTEELVGAARLWLKAPRGLGGDLVQPINTKNLAPMLIAEAIYKFREKVFKQWTEAAEHTCLSAEAIAAFWNPNDFMPAHMPLVVEVDGTVGKDFKQAPGEIILVGSNIMLVQHDGTFSMHGEFVQHTDKDGGFHGSSSNNLSPEIAVLVAEEMRKGAKYCAQTLQLNGFVGWDYLVVKHVDGSLEVKIIELNARPSASLFGAAISAKAGFRVHEQLTILAQTAINSMEDVREIIPDSLLNGQSAGVIPVQTYGLHHSELGTLFSSNKLKLIVGAATNEELTALKQQIARRGLRIA